MADLTAPPAVSLRKDAIGLREVLFQSITDMAPGAAIAASIPFGATYAGGSLPLAVVLVLAVLLIIHAGAANTLSVFGTGHTPPDHAGIAGVIAGSVYTILAFGGFEGAAPLAEEARDPRRTVRRAVLLATLSIGILYIFTTYAVDVAFGPGRFAGFGTSGGDSWEGLARSLYGGFWVLVFLAIVNSTVANANAGVNVSTRTAFAMGRVGAFPYALARLSTRHRS